MIVSMYQFYKIIIKAQEARAASKEKPVDKNPNLSDEDVARLSKNAHSGTENSDKIKNVEGDHKSEEDNSTQIHYGDEGHDFFVLNLTDDDSQFNLQAFSYLNRSHDLVQYYVGAGKSSGVHALGLIPGFDHADSSHVFDVLRSVFEGKSHLPIDLLGLFNAPPVVQSATAVIDEDIPLSGALVGSDREGLPLTFSIVEQAQHGNVTLNPDGTYVYTPDEDFNGVDTFIVKANDGFKDSANATVAITINPVNDAPKISNFFIDANNAPILNPHVDENNPGAIVGYLSATDPEGDSFTWSIVDAGTPFEIVNGVLKLRDDVSLDYEVDGGSISVTIQAQDTSGLVSVQTFTINLIDINEIPVLNQDLFDQFGGKILNPHVDENDPGAVVGYLSVTDPDGDDLVFVVSDDRFEVVDGALKLKDGVALNYEDVNVTPIEVGVQAEDGRGGFDSQIFRIYVQDINEAPTDIALSNSAVNEIKTNVVVGTLSALDPDAGDSFTFSVVNDTRFAIDGTDLKLVSALDYETLPNHQTSVTVRATDAGGLSFDKEFTITVNDVNENPPKILGYTDNDGDVYTINRYSISFLPMFSKPENEGDSSWQVNLDRTGNYAYTLTGDYASFFSISDTGLITQDTIINDKDIPWYSIYGTNDAYRRLSLSVKVTDIDNGLSDTYNLVLAIEDVPLIIGYTDNHNSTYMIDYAPGNVSFAPMFTTPENQIGNTWQVNSPAGGNYEYSISGVSGYTGSQTNIFSISSTGLITQNKLVDDKETTLNSFAGYYGLTLGITVKDLDTGISDTQNLVLKIKDVSPSITGFSSDGVTGLDFTENEYDIGKTWQVLLGNSSPYEVANQQYVYSLSISSASNPGLTNDQILALLAKFTINSATGLITQIQDIDVNDVPQDSNGNGKLVLNVRVNDTNLDYNIVSSSSSANLTININDARDDVTAKPGIGPLITVFNNVNYTNIFDASELFNIKTTEKLVYSIVTNNFGFVINPDTGLIYRPTAPNSNFPALVDLNVFVSDDDSARDAGTDATAIVSLKIINPISITSNQPYFLVTRNDFNNGMFGDLANLSSRNLSFQLDAGMPGKIVNYYNGTYAYLDYNFSTKSTGLTTSPQLVAGTMFVDGISHRFAFNVTDVTPLVLNFGTSFSNLKDGGDGRTGNYPNPGDKPSAAYDGASFSQNDVRVDDGIIYAPNVGNAGNGGTGGTGGKGGDGLSVFSFPTAGGDGGDGGNGGSISYTLDNSSSGLDQIIMGGDTGFSGVGGSAGSAGAPGAGPYGKDGGQGGYGGDGGSIDYKILAGSGNDTILLGKAGYSAATSKSDVRDGDDGHVLYSVDGGAGNDYFIINQLPTPNPGGKSETIVSVKGGDGDDVIDLQVAFFASGQYGSLRIDGGTGFDSLVVHNNLGEQVYFNDDNPFGPYSVFYDRDGHLLSAQYRISNIDLIDLRSYVASDGFFNFNQGATLTISAADIDNIVAADSNGVHTLFVNGFTLPSLSMGQLTFDKASTVKLYGAAHDFDQSIGTVTKGTILYDSYQIDANTVLNVQQGLIRYDGDNRYDF